MRILIVDDDVEQRTLLVNLVMEWGLSVRPAPAGAVAMAQLAEFRPHVLLLHWPLADPEELTRLLRSNVRTPVILVTPSENHARAMEAAQRTGAFGAIETPIDAGTLRVLLARAAEQGMLLAENERLRADLVQRGVLGELVGRSVSLRMVMDLIRQVAPTDANILISGESGTGKELAARTIHALSPRAAEPFVAVNGAAMSESSIESELFGHEKGSFPGAVDWRAGALELAAGGTLFLDDISEMPLSVQAKLLRVLDDSRYRRIGGDRELRADVRVIAATSRRPDEAVAEGRIKDSLFYRVNTVHIVLPPLRERVDDIPLIAASMIEKLNQKHGTRVTHLDEQAVLALQGAAWKGNVRELRNTVERAVILAGSGPVLRSHLVLTTLPPAVRAAAAGAGGGTATPNGLSVSVGMTISEAERVLIEATLKEAGNVKTRAADILGISAKTLHAKLNQYRSSDSSRLAAPAGIAAVNTAPKP